MMIKFLKRYEKLKEMALEKGGRAYDIRFLYVVKESEVELRRFSD